MRRHSSLTLSLQRRTAAVRIWREQVQNIQKLNFIASKKRGEEEGILLPENVEQRKKQSHYEVNKDMKSRKFHTIRSAH